MVLGSSTNLVLLAELVLTYELGLLTSLALLAVELVLAMEKEACFRFPLGGCQNSLKPFRPDLNRNKSGLDMA